MTVDVPETAPRRRAGARARGRLWMIVAIGAVSAGVAGWLALGTPGMGDGSGGDNLASTPVEALTPDEFADRMADPEVVVINVHVPYEGEIAGTHALIPYDEMAGDTRLPAGEDTEILLYCRTGRMSESAARTLTAEGYTDVAHLDGGMQAWTAAGYQLTDHQT